MPAPAPLAARASAGPDTIVAPSRARIAARRGGLLCRVRTSPVRRPGNASEGDHSIFEPIIGGIRRPTIGPKTRVWMGLGACVAQLLLLTATTQDAAAV